MLAQVRRPISEVRPQLPFSATISTIKPSRRCPTSARSTASNSSAHSRSHLPPQPNPHSGVRGMLRASPPRVRSLAAFGRRPPVDVARLSLAGIRNPAQDRKTRKFRMRGSPGIGRPPPSTWRRKTRRRCGADGSSTSIVLRPRTAASVRTLPSSPRIRRSAGLPPNEGPPSRSSRTTADLSGVASTRISASFVTHRNDWPACNSS